MKPLDAKKMRKLRKILLSCKTAEQCEATLDWINGRIKTLGYDSSVGKLDFTSLSLATEIVQDRVGAKC